MLNFTWEAVADAVKLPRNELAVTLFDGTTHVITTAEFLTLVESGRAVGAVDPSDGIQESRPRA